MEHDKSSEIKNTDVNTGANTGAINSSKDKVAILSYIKCSSGW